MKNLRILAWDHRRATDPLRHAISAFQAQNNGVEIEIDIRPLSAFEHQGMAGAVRACDMIVYDHPFSGDVAERELFLPLDAHMPDLLAPEHGSLYIGPSLESYRHGGRIWGAPIDGATQHAILRADLLEKINAAVPKSWQDAESLGRTLRQRGMYLALPIETPHAMLTIGALMANMGRPWSADPHMPVVLDSDALRTAMAHVRQLLAYCPKDTLEWNSIDVHEAMVNRDDIAYCPCVYGYATYGEPDMRRPLSFADFAGPNAPFHAGSVLGGTAIGISRHTQHPELALSFARFMLQTHIQDGIIPENHGQPATMQAWNNPEHDARFNGFYSAVRASMQTAWIRPRLPRYPEFQRDAGQALARYFRDEASEKQTVDSLLALASQLNRHAFSSRSEEP